MGLGNWGTALANHLASNRNSVLGWSIEPEVVSGINKENRNPNYLSDVQLHKNLSATENLEETLSSDFVLLVVPSAAMEEVLPKIKLRDGTILVSAVKGIVEKQCMTPLQYARSVLPKSIQLAVLSGPSFAKDVVRGKPCGIVAAANSEEVAMKVAELFSVGSMKAYASTDPLGVELGGILKNVIALAAGICDGLDLGESARAGVITRGLAEMMRLAEVLGADRQTLSGLSGLGDLAMTSTSPLSRNRTVGFLLGQGKSLDEIIASLGSVAEGVRTTPLVISLAQKAGVEMPIAEEVSRVLKEETSPEQLVEALLSRPLKREF